MVAALWVCPLHSGAMMLDTNISTLTCSHWQCWTFLRFMFCFAGTWSQTKIQDKQWLGMKSQVITRVILICLGTGTLDPDFMASLKSTNSSSKNPQCLQYVQWLLLRYIVKDILIKLVDSGARMAKTYINFSGFCSNFRLFLFYGIVGKKKNTLRC